MSKMIKPEQANRIGRRQCLRLFGGASVALAAGCATAPSRPPEEDFEYRRAVRPMPMAAGVSQEVVEFFWYGCPHCRAFEPVLAKWRRTLSPSVAFRKVHAALGPAWVPHQQLFDTLSVLDRADDEMNQKVFDAIQVDGNPLDTRDRMADFAAKMGVDRARFVETFDSVAVRTRMGEADERVKAMGVTGVPGLGINGRWLTSPGMAGDQASALKVADFLLSRDRAGGSAAAT